MPPKNGTSTASTSSIHGMATGEPALTTTMVRSLAAATRRTSSSWSPGRAMVSRSWPSVSHSSVVPTTTTAASAARAASTARSIMCSSAGSRTPMRMAPKGWRIRSVTSIGISSPARASTVPSCSADPKP
jgi:hypothetical protein